MRRTHISVLAVIAILVMITPARAATTGYDRARALTDEDVLSALGANTREVSPGHYETTLEDGTTLRTHGPDPSDSLMDHGPGIEPGDPERDPVCATDYHQHVLYGRLSGSGNRYASVVGQIRSSMKRINAVLNESGQLSGNKSADYKVRCDADNSITVGSFTSSATDFNSIVNGARNAGFTASNADYTIFFDGNRSGICGTASIEWDESASVNNANNRGGGYAVTYLSCWDSRTPAHENGHNQGAVQQSATDSTGTGGHCNDTYDVMCYVPDGGNRNQSEVRRCNTVMAYDCENDTYFDAEPEAGEWLATHWNIGSSVNRFIMFDAPPAPPILTQPLEGASVYGPPVTIAGTAKATSTVRVREAGTVIGTTTAAANGSWSIDLTFGEGPHSVTATAESPGGEGAPSPSRNFTVIIDTNPPEPPVITSPTEGGYVGAAATVEGTTEPSATVTVHVDGAPAGSNTADGNGNFSVAITLADGTHTLTAVARDLGRNDSAPSAPVTVEVDTTPPETTFDQTPNTIFLNRPVELSGTASDNSDVTRVVLRFYNVLGNFVTEEEAILGEPDSEGLRPWSGSVALVSGRYRVDAIAIDVAGVEGGASMFLWKIGFN